MRSEYVVPLSLLVGSMMMVANAVLQRWFGDSCVGVSTVLTCCLVERVFCRC